MDAAGTLTYLQTGPLGQWGEAGSGLYQNWHRTYDASLGRYLEADPLGLAVGQSLYGYVAQDPVNQIDPKGLEKKGGDPKDTGTRDAGLEAKRGVSMLLSAYKNDAIPIVGFTGQIANDLDRSMSGLPPGDYSEWDFVRDVCPHPLEVLRQIKAGNRPLSSQPPPTPISPSGEVDRTVLFGGGKR